MNFEISHLIEILSQTPATLKSLLGNLSDEWIYDSDVENVWSPFDVVGHLIHADETDWMPRAEIILACGENPTFEPFDRFGHLEKSKGKTLAELLEALAKLRQKNIGILESWNLSDEQLNLKGIHPEIGEVSLKQLLATWLVHDLNHIRQIVNVMARRQTENVGEWKQYLSILKD
jgi:DinB superfamily